MLSIISLPGVIMPLFSSYVNNWIGAKLTLKIVYTGICISPILIYFGMVYKNYYLCLFG